MSKVSQSAGCLTVTHNSLNVHVLHEQTQMLEQHLSAGLLLMLGDVCGFFFFFFCAVSLKVNGNRSMFARLLPVLHKLDARFITWQFSLMGS